MKAIRIEQFGDAGVLKVAEIDKPEVGNGQILVQVATIGVNPVDTYLRAGMYPVLPKLPFTPGLDAAGTIAELGEGVAGWKVGDRVYIVGSLSGAYAEFVLCTPQQVHPLPDGNSFGEGAAVGTAGAAAWRSLYIQGEARAGQKLLIHGASGSVGTTAVQLARATGMAVYGTAGTKKGLDLVSGLGASVFDHTSSDYLDQMKVTTGGRGFDLILEMLANINLEKDLDLLAPRGKVIIVGSRGRIEIDPRATMGAEREIRGMSLFNATPAENNETHAALVAAMETKILKPIISREMPLSDAPKAHELVLESGNCGKLVLTL